MIIKFVLIDEARNNSHGLTNRITTVQQNVLPFPERINANPKYS